MKCKLKLTPLTLAGSYDLELIPEDKKFKSVSVMTSVVLAKQLDDGKDRWKLHFFDNTYPASYGLDRKDAAKSIGLRLTKACYTELAEKIFSKFDGKIEDRSDDAAFKKVIGKIGSVDLSDAFVSKVFEENDAKYQKKFGTGLNESFIKSVNRFLTESHEAKSEKMVSIISLNIGTVKEILDAINSKYGSDVRYSNCETHIWNNGPSKEFEVKFPVSELQTGYSTLDIGHVSSELKQIVDDDEDFSYSSSISIED